VEAWVFDHALLSGEVNRQVLLPFVGEEELVDQLLPVRTLVEAALGDLRAASIAPLSITGLLRWDALAEQGLLASIQALAEVMLASLPSGSAGVPLGPDSPYAVQLWRLFDVPLTHDRLVQANGGEPLTVAFGGAPAGRTFQSRLARTLWHDRGSSSALWEAFMVVPAAPDDVQCTQAPSVCPAGFACEDVEAGVCSAATASACAEDEGCPLGESCVRERRCVRAAPEGLSWTDVENAFSGPDAPGLSPWVWHLLQPLVGKDPAQPMASAR
jgi:hypothetical protein